jgi:hypothetical protein
LEERVVAGGSVLMLTCSQVVGDVDVMWSWVRDECGRDTSGEGAAKWQLHATRFAQIEMG